MPQDQYEAVRSMCLATPIPTVVYWGPAYLRIANDGWRTIFEHGAPELEVKMGPLLTAAFDRGESSRAEVGDRTLSCAPIRGAEGILGAVCSVTAVADAPSARAISEREFLSKASAMLAESLDPQTTLQTIAQLLIPDFADWCEIDVRTREGGIQMVAIAHHDPAKHQSAQRFVGTVHLTPDFEHGQAFAIHNGKSDLVPDLDPEILNAAVGDAEEFALFQQLGTRSFVSVPLIWQGRTLGAIGTVYGDSGRTYSAQDLPMLEELGRRAGLALHNAQTYERQQRVASSFQEASLPGELPRVSGLRFDALYRPGSSEAQVGGDWYDALRLIDGRVVVSIGDVSGSGLDAAVTMGNMRQIIRGIAQVHADPALMLDAADRALRLEHPDQYATACVGVIDPIAKTLMFASAGHPPALLRNADGSLSWLSDGGLPLGLREGREGGESRCVALAPGSALILYTDGLTEARHEPLDGESRLGALLADGKLLSRPHPAAALQSALLEGAQASDDVAILVVGVDAESEHSPLQRWTFDSLDARAGQLARREFSDALTARGCSFEDVYMAEMVFGELVGNVVRYAPGDVEIIVDWSAALPVLHVIDGGAGFRHLALLPADIFSESGRGLFLVAALTSAFSVSRRPSGGSHARAVLSFARSRLAPMSAAMSATILEGMIGAI